MIIRCDYDQITERKKKKHSQYIATRIESHPPAILAIEEISVKRRKKNYDTVVREEKILTSLKTTLLTLFTGEFRSLTSLYSDVQMVYLLE